MGVELKTWNLAVFCAGVPGTGKSYFAVRYAEQLARRAGGYVVAHDPTGGYAGAQIHRYATVDALWKRLTTAPGGVHVLDVPDGGEVIAAACRLAEAAAKNRPKGVTKVAPVVCLLDEIVAVEGASPSRLDDQLRTVLARRRHIGSGVGLIWTSQSMYFANRALLGLSTELVLFRLTAEQDLDRLRKAGIPDDVVRAVAQLPDRAKISWKGGKATRLAPDVFLTP